MRIRLNEIIKNVNSQITCGTSQKHITQRLPLTFAEVGADPASIPRLVEMNNIGDGVTGGYVGLDRAAHFEIYEIAAGLR